MGITQQLDDVLPFVYPTSISFMALRMYMVSLFVL